MPSRFDWYLLFIVSVSSEISVKAFLYIKSILRLSLYQISINTAVMEFVTSFKVKIEVMPFPLSRVLLTD